MVLNALAQLVYYYGTTARSCETLLRKLKSNVNS